MGHYALIGNLSNWYDQRREAFLRAAIGCLDPVRTPAFYRDHFLVVDLFYYRSEHISYFKFLSATAVSWDDAINRSSRAVSQRLQFRRSLFPLADERGVRTCWVLLTIGSMKVVFLPRPSRCHAEFAAAMADPGWEEKLKQTLNA